MSEGAPLMFPRGGYWRKNHEEAQWSGIDLKLMRVKYAPNRKAFNDARALIELSSARAEEYHAHTSPAPARSVSLRVL